MTDINYTKNIYLDRVAEKADCHEDLKNNRRFDKSKRKRFKFRRKKHLIFGYKNLISSRRSVWRSIKAFVIKEKNSNSKLV